MSIAKEFWPRCEDCKGYGCDKCEGGRVRPADEPESTNGKKGKKDKKDKKDG